MSFLLNPVSVVLSSSSFSPVLVSGVENSSSSSSSSSSATKRRAIPMSIPKKIFCEWPDPFYSLVDDCAHRRLPCQLNEIVSSFLPIETSIMLATLNRGGFRTSDARFMLAHLSQIRTLNVKELEICSFLLAQREISGSILPSRELVRAKMNEVLSRCKNLTSFEYDGAWANIPPEEFGEWVTILTTKCPNLKRIKLPDEYIGISSNYEKFTKFTQVRKTLFKEATTNLATIAIHELAFANLYNYHNNLLANDTLQRMAGLTRLESFTYRTGSLEFPLQSLIDAVKHWPSLKHFSLTWDGLYRRDLVARDLPIALGSHCPHLQNLTIDALSDQGIEAMAKGCPDLTSLCCYNSREEEITEEGLKLIKNFRKLTDLTLWNCPIPEGGFGSALIKVSLCSNDIRTIKPIVEVNPALDYAFFLGCRLEGDGGIPALVNCVFLKQLILEGCDLGNERLKLLERCLPNLEKLTDLVLTGNNSLNRSDVKRLREIWPRIEIETDNDTYEDSEGDISDDE